MLCCWSRARRGRRRTSLRLGSRAVSAVPGAVGGAPAIGHCCGLGLCEAAGPQGPRDEGARRPAALDARQGPLHPSSPTRGQAAEPDPGVLPSRAPPQQRCPPGGRQAGASLAASWLGLARCLCEQESVQGWAVLPRERPPPPSWQRGGGRAGVRTRGLGSSRGRGHPGGDTEVWSPLPRAAESEAPGLCARVCA